MDALPPNAATGRPICTVLANLIASRLVNFARLGFIAILLSVRSMVREIEHDSALVSIPDQTAFRAFPSSATDRRRTCRARHDECTLQFASAQRCRRIV